MNNSIGEVLALFVSKKGHVERIQKSEIFLDEKGIIGDKFYAKDIERSVLLTSRESYSLALEHHISMEYGTLGENILIDYNPYQLFAGRRLTIGTATIEITQNCTICNHLSTVDKKLPKLLKDDRGIFVKVVGEGIIKKGDKVFLLKAPYIL